MVNSIAKERFCVVNFYQLIYLGKASKGRYIYQSHGFYGYKVLEGVGRFSHIVKSAIFVVLFVGWKPEWPVPRRKTPNPTEIHPCLSWTHQLAKWRWRKPPFCKLVGPRTSGNVFAWSFVTPTAGNGCKPAIIPGEGPKILPGPRRISTQDLEQTSKSQDRYASRNPEFPLPNLSGNIPFFQTHQHKSVKYTCQIRCGVNHILFRHLAIFWNTKDLSEKEFPYF